MGVIARMPLQFGLLTGAVRPDREFDEDDHRSFRLTREIVEESIELLTPFWEASAALEMSPTQAALCYAAGVPGVSTVIPGIRTPEQAEQNAAVFCKARDRVVRLAEALPADPLLEIVALMQARG
jgi:aryl-alcohol dehydrogenase-like predicted oxidoreductase